MQLSKNILQGVLLGLGAIALATTHTDAAAQSNHNANKAVHLQKDTVVVTPPAPETDTPSTTQAKDPVVQPSDATEIIYKHPCIACGRG